MVATLRIGMLGYGRFGAAFAGLLPEHGYSWRSWDPAAEIPEGNAAPDVESLLAQSDLIVLAVPLDRFTTVLRDLRPRLVASRHRVLDVCSVKEMPCRIMDEVLGDEIGHVGCHPLFGPLSIARADPLRVLVCPSARHPDVARTACALFSSIGAEVMEQTPDEHDQYMALTHAMAFFIARGLLDLGIDGDLCWAPPSFAALAASIAAVRADAGHLFAAMQTQNPYAAAGRRKFIEALTSIDRRLVDAPLRAETHPDPGIPALAPTSPALGETREHIDELDRELIALLQRRAGLSRGAPS